MTTMKKIFSMLALLLLTAVGATAQTTYTVTVKGGTEKVKRVTAAMAAPLFNVFTHLPLYLS